MSDVPGLPGPVPWPTRNSWGPIRRGETRPVATGTRDLTLLELVTARRYHAGQTPAEIAAAMGTSRGAVNQRVDQIRRKLGLASRADLREWLAAHADELEEPG